MKHRKWLALLLAILMCLQITPTVFATSYGSTETQNGLIVQPNDELTFSDDTIAANLTARWGVRVIFEDYDHTEFTNVVVPVGDNAPGSSVAPADPQREGYTFVGWERTDQKTGTASLNEDGTVTGINGPGAIVFTAVYEQSETPPVPPSGTGSLTIRKEVSGTGTPAGDTRFEFTVTKDGAAAVGQYAVDDGTAQPIPSDGKILLQAGQGALLTGLEPGTYVVTETTPAHENYESTSFSVNNGDVENGVSATVTVTEAVAAVTGGWKMENGSVVKDDDGYFTYVITKDQLDGDGNITVNCDPLAEYMEYAMRSYQNFTSVKFKVKFVNETGVPIKYQDYSFDTVNWIPVGDTYTPSGNPSMLNTNEGADEHSAGYGWGESWQNFYPMLTGSRLATTTLDATGFDGNNVRITMAPLTCINPAVMSYFKSNPGYETLTGNKNISSAANITLLQMNAFPELIKEAFSFKDYQGNEISLAADNNRTYADFICAFYGVSSLDELTIAQKYNVLGTGYAGSPAMAYSGQSLIYTYYANSSADIKNWCVPYAALNDGTLDHFKTWGLSTSRLEAGKKLTSNGQVLSEDDANTYAYQQNYYLMESDPEVIAMAYEYLYERCIRLTLDDTDRPVSGRADNNATPVEDVSGIKSYMDKTDTANANVLAAMNNGAEIADHESITLDNVKGFIEVPNAWSLFNYFDFGFEIDFKATTLPEEPQAASVTFVNAYKQPETPPPSGSTTGNLTVSKTVTGNAGDTAKDFSFTVTLENTLINGTYGEMVFTNGAATFTLRHNENKTATNLPEGVKYTVVESDNDGYTVTVNGVAGATASGSIAADETTAVTFNNHKESGSGETPGGPDDPVNPPDGPDDPVTPPDDPDKPVTPPDKPDEPSKPDKPDEPSRPDNPDKPNKPDKTYDDVPKTGDTSHTSLWFVLMCISAVGLIITSRKIRYRGVYSKK